MNGTKSAITSIGVMTPFVALIVMGLNQFVFKGSVVTDADVTNIINDIAATVGLLGGIYGRWKATKQVTLTGR